MLPELHSHLIIQAIGDEVLVLDAGRDTAHLLNAPCSLVFYACQRGASAEETAAQLGVDGEVQLAVALDSLQQAGLIFKSSPSGLSRRQLLALGASVVVPAITSLGVPKPVHAASNCINCPIGDVCSDSLPFGVCQPCGVAGVAPCPASATNCRSLHLRRRTTASCSGDSFFPPNPLCIDVTATNDPRVQEDCTAAHAAATSSQPYTLSRCDGVILNLPANAYACCQNCS